ncbi:hypothetical protein OG884_18640 [Streptosporangium sp. NBC_01755]|uniref:phosphatase domain-containing protein n=1 Tax=unclassified Streptosporangium TaxID=2632669 RepID=UPI002DDA9A88|nr:MULTISPECIES: hypothetical protein [unclassified Streptosporangium]WSA23714.1 hypothetical protein OIE13_22495 [Streptosporangium sp. NBC_01810]WSD03826.1 hypothetical protein OG884_18640 [Streptosporangium sp. NBC_01755]
MSKALWIVDLDGTLALRGDRDPYDWHRVGEDAPNPPVVAVVRALILAGHPVAYVSGRKEQCRYQTEVWLCANVGYWDDVEGLWMRADHDNRPDVQVKHDIYTEHFAHREIAGVIDDRAAVVRMWREELGLTVLQVAEGNY